MQGRNEDLLTGGLEFDRGLEFDWSVLVLTSCGMSPSRRYFRGILLRANLQPLKYILQEQPKEKEAPQVFGSTPWQAHVRLERKGGREMGRWRRAGEMERGGEMGRGRRERREKDGEREERGKEGERWGEGGERGRMR